ncbi:ImmA/IrrE family metallo-endopeptidase [Frankia sp. AgB1.9]|uniref:ImmA/IrrE family metallo-endopeptidase n=1 Tax=unclassified Frankia TaxID=2632575 RepID=UPI0019323146|nr:MULTISPECIES: ImmA/IrrE family metallo-endopeptidase [unclassified Frankia]MBL7487245.1 ImmA/IrrE family metallo-endopeptidase [Frankia sp. AgW1.1]MBL7547991.1 ImmA/IrrE family metallo-endopeptidase [Frankia sp. AgB1.9]MBL7625016.1 ImmA/IrrE family metallo-endopeptidase [Frankia sp. AgB1.8]
MRRGFKTEAEKISQEIRTAMGKRPTDPLDALDLAKHLGAWVRRADELTTLSKLRALEELQPGAFSACTFTLEDRHVIVYSPLALPGRTQSDVAHETSHIILRRAPKEVRSVGKIAFFTCDPDEEQEANWLAGCLLLPRPLLLSALRRGIDAAGIAAAYGVSEQMAHFRIRTTGVERQLSAIRRA